MSRATAAIRSGEITVTAVGRAARVGLLALLLAGCSEGGQQSCRVDTVADLPLLANTRAPAVKASLDGSDVVLLIDTGAAISAVSSSAADRFALRGSLRSRSVLLDGIGGATLAPLVTVRHLGLGYGHARDLELPVLSGLPASLQGLPVLGLFGADFMANYDVDIDVPNHHFALYDLHQCGKRIEPFDPPYFQVPFHLDGTAIRLDLKLNDTMLNAELDSGSSITTITEEDARRAGVTKTLLASDPADTRLIGIDQHAVHAHRHQFGSLEIGSERMNNFHFAVADIATSTTLLGADFFRFNRVWISYSRELLFIQPANHLTRYTVK